jgi:predicted nucleic acid-binding protein
VIAAVIDCSAMVDLLNSAGAAALQSNEELADCLLAAPHLIDPEFVSMARRIGRHDADRAERAEQLLIEFSQVPIMRFEHGPLRQHAWTWRHQLSAYDAMYVALAHELRIPLVTSDSRLAVAATKWCETRLLAELGGPQGTGRPALQPPVDPPIAGRR